MTASGSGAARGSGAKTTTYPRSGGRKDPPPRGRRRHIRKSSPTTTSTRREALGGHGIYAIASGMHLDNRFARGGLCSPDDEIRDEAVRHCADFAGSLGARMIIWPGIEGYNYSFQTPYRAARERFRALYPALHPAR